VIALRDVARSVLDASWRFCAAVNCCVACTASRPPLLTRLSSPTTGTSAAAIVLADESVPSDACSMACPIACACEPVRLRLF
jgi:hypothetical protein